MRKIYKYYLIVIVIISVSFTLAYFVAKDIGKKRLTLYEEAIVRFEEGNVDKAMALFMDATPYQNSSKFISAIEQFKAGKYIDAYTSILEISENLENFTVPQEWFLRSQIQHSQILYSNGKYDETISVVSEIIKDIGDGENSENILAEAKAIFERACVAYAQELYSQGKYQEALNILAQDDEFQSFSSLSDNIVYSYAQRLLSEKKYKRALDFFNQLTDSLGKPGYEDLDNQINYTKYAYAKQLLDEGEFENALQLLLELGDYKDSSKLIEEILKENVSIETSEVYQEAVYQIAEKHLNMRLYWIALSEFKSISDYKDSKNRIEEVLTDLRRALGTTVSVGLNYSVAVKNDGSAIATEYFQGISDVNNALWTNLVSISGFSAVTAGLTLDGDVLVTNEEISKDIDPDDWQDIVAISVGEQYVVGLKGDGTLVSAGHDAGDGQRDVDDWANIRAIATGWRHTVGLDSDGNVLIAGYNSTYQLNRILNNKKDWSDIVAIAAGGGSNGHFGRGHTVGLRRDGKVVAVGDNTYNQCDVAEWDSVVAIAAGDWFTAGLRADGSVIITHPNPDTEGSDKIYTGVYDAETWGNQDGNKIISIAAGGGSIIGLYENGSIVAAGYGVNSTGQTSVANGWKDILVYDNQLNDFEEAYQN